MSLAYKRFRVYLRLIVLILLVGAVGLVLFENREHKVNVWFFGLVDRGRQINVLWVILWTALFTRVAWFLMAFSFRLWKDFRDVRSADAQLLAQSELKRREAELLEREQRLTQQANAAPPFGVAD